MLRHVAFAGLIEIFIRESFLRLVKVGLIRQVSLCRFYFLLSVSERILKHGEAVVGGTSMRYLVRKILHQLLPTGAFYIQRFAARSFTLHIKVLLEI